MLLKKITPVYIENHTVPTTQNSELLIVNAGWYMQLSLGFEGLKMAAFWDVLRCSLLVCSLVMRSSHDGVISSSETLISIYESKRRNVTEDSHIRFQLNTFWGEKIIDGPNRNDSKYQ
jgi:hypothetical protein